MLLILHIRYTFNVVFSWKRCFSYSNMKQFNPQNQDMLISCSVSWCLISAISAPPQRWSIFFMLLSRMQASITSSLKFRIISVDGISVLSIKRGRFRFICNSDNFELKRSEKSLVGSFHIIDWMAVIQSELIWRPSVIYIDLLIWPRYMSNHPKSTSI